jgi:hypothetical protein
MYRPILALLLVTACEGSPPDAPYELKPEPAAPSDAGAPEPVVAPHAPEPSRPAPVATEQAPFEPMFPPVQPNGCFDGYRDLGCACAPPIDPGDCDCKTGHLCARSCKRDGDGVANVAVFCLDGGAP